MLYRFLVQHLGTPLSHRLLKVPELLLNHHHRYQAFLHKVRDLNHRRGLFNHEDLKRPLTNRPSHRVLLHSEHILPLLVQQACSLTLLPYNKFLPILLLCLLLRWLLILNPNLERYLHINIDLAQLDQGIKHLHDLVQDRNQDPSNLLDRNKHLHDFSNLHLPLELFVECEVLGMWITLQVNLLGRAHPLMPTKVEGLLKIGII